jgi:hypothetical protein
MRYELRTTLDISADEFVADDPINSSDRLLRWLYEYLPTKATLGADLATPRWVGSRYNEPDVRFEVVSWYRDVFAATADRLRIEEAVRTLPPGVRELVEQAHFALLRVYGDAELVNWADPTKPRITFP